MPGGVVGSGPTSGAIGAGVLASGVRVSLCLCIRLICSSRSAFPNRLFPPVVPPFDVVCDICFEPGFNPTKVAL